MLLHFGLLENINRGHHTLFSLCSLFTVVFVKQAQANLTGQDAPHVANVDFSRPGGPENGSGSAVSNQHAAEHFDRTCPTREDRDHNGQSR